MSLFSLGMNKLNYMKYSEAKDIFNSGCVAKKQDSLKNQFGLEIADFLYKKNNTINDISFFDENYSSFLKYAEDNDFESKFIIALYNYYGLGSINVKYDLYKEYISQCLNQDYAFDFYYLNRICFNSYLEEYYKLIIELQELLQINLKKINKFNSLDGKINKIYTRVTILYNLLINENKLEEKDITKFNTLEFKMVLYQCNKKPKQCILNKALININNDIEEEINHNNEFFRNQKLTNKLGDIAFYPLLSSLRDKLDLAKYNGYDNYLVYLCNQNKLNYSEIEDIYRYLKKELNNDKNLYNENEFFNSDSNIRKSSSIITIFKGYNILLDFFTKEDKNLANYLKKLFLNEEIIFVKNDLMNKMNKYYISNDNKSVLISINYNGSVYDFLKLTELIVKSYYELNNIDSKKAYINYYNLMFKTNYVYTTMSTDFWSFVYKSLVRFSFVNEIMIGVMDLYSNNKLSYDLFSNMVINSLRNLNITNEDSFVNSYHIVRLIEDYNIIKYYSFLMGFKNSSINDLDKNENIMNFSSFISIVDQILFLCKKEIII